MPCYLLGENSSSTPDWSGRSGAGQWVKSLTGSKPEFLVMWAVWILAWSCMKIRSDCQSIGSCSSITFRYTAVVIPSLFESESSGMKTRLDFWSPSSKQVQIITDLFLSLLWGWIISLSHLRADVWKTHCHCLPESHSTEHSSLHKKIFHSQASQCSWSLMNCRHLAAISEVKTDFFLISQFIMSLFFKTW